MAPDMETCGSRSRPYCARWGPSSPAPKGAQPPIFSPFQLWPNGWMYQDVTWYGGRPRLMRRCVRWGPSPSLKGQCPQFSANCRCGQTAGWTKMPLGTVPSVYSLVVSVNSVKWVCLRPVLMLLLFLKIMFTTLIVYILVFVTSSVKGIWSWICFFWVIFCIFPSVSNYYWLLWRQTNTNRSAVSLKRVCCLYPSGVYLNYSMPCRCYFPFTGMDFLERCTSYSNSVCLSVRLSLRLSRW